jgi:hypothetical protein
MHWRCAAQGVPACCGRGGAIATPRTRPGRPPAHPPAPAALWCAGAGELHLEICLKDLQDDFMGGAEIK